MSNKIFFSFLIISTFTAFLFYPAYAQESFPFDNQCLKFDKANFKEGGALLDVMTTGDFPQYCVLYSLSSYQVNQKRDDGYFIVGSKLDPQHAQETLVFLKTKESYQQNQVLAGKDLAVSKPIGKWAYFVNTERFAMDDKAEKEFYVFQEIDF